MPKPNGLFRLFSVLSDDFARPTSGDQCVGATRRGECGMSEKLRVLTIRQPWAELIIRGIKPVENRTWQTTYRGSLLIHAAAKYDVDGALDAVQSGQISYGAAWICATAPRGAIIGQVDLADCVQDSSSEWAEEGCWHWLLENPQVFDEPIPWRGRQGLWTITEAELEAARKEAAG